jgi:hypothetical protein
VTGGVIECWTMDTPDPARGREYHVVVIDEAGIVRDMEQIWQAAIFPTLTRHAGRASVLGTPKGRTHGFSTMFAKGASGGSQRWASVRAPTQTTRSSRAKKSRSPRLNFPLVSSRRSTKASRPTTAATRSASTAIAKLAWGR